MIKSPVYGELAQAAAFSLSSISRIFMANCSSVKGFRRKRLRKSCFCQPSSRDVWRKDSEFGWGMVLCGVLPPYRIRRYLRPSLFLHAIATYRYCLRHGDWKTLSRLSSGHRTRNGVLHFAHFATKAAGDLELVAPVCGDNDITPVER